MCSSQEHEAEFTLLRATTSSVLEAPGIMAGDMLFVPFSATDSYQAIRPEVVGLRAQFIRLPSNPESSQENQICPPGVYTKENRVIIRPRSRPLEKENPSGMSSEDLLRTLPACFLTPLRMNSGPLLNF